MKNLFQVLLELLDDYEAKKPTMLGLLHESLSPLKAEEPFERFVEFATAVLEKYPVMSQFRDSSLSSLAVGLNLGGKIRTYLPGKEIDGFNPNASAGWVSVTGGHMNHAMPTADAVAVTGGNK